MASNLAGWLADGEDLICSDEDGSNSPDVEGKDFDPGHVNNVPSTRILKDIDSVLQSQYGILSVHYQGALGHIYYVNHLPSIITQVTSRWLYEIDPTIAMPMICKGQQDFYVFELMKLMDGTVIVPKHWYTKLSTPGSPSSNFEYWGHVWRAHPVVSDHTHGYVVHMYETMEVQMRGCSVLPWTLTNPAVSNRWHMLAQGHHVLSYMIWLYCDNTSGNTSKKWNKHNLFLFTAAGLPCVMVHKESSIHFLATSNIAPPLGMLDGIMDQLE
ncbi:hypothetical protein EDC04DRAFT_2869548 [Pisolithus marmoratus]|nr:hypothetical protein EDC04DRAFT_2869548 [Pisolithus marmoratus]